MHGRTEVLNAVLGIFNAEESVSAQKGTSAVGTPEWDKSNGIHAV